MPSFTYVIAFGISALFGFLFLLLKRKSEREKEREKLKNELEKEMAEAIKSGDTSRIFAVRNKLERLLPKRS